MESSMKTDSGLVEQKEALMLDSGGCGNGYREGKIPDNSTSRQDGRRGTGLKIPATVSCIWVSPVQTAEPRDCRAGPVLSK